MRKGAFEVRAALCLLAGIAPPASMAAQERGPAEAELVVFAAASLSGAFQELAGVYQRTRPGTRVTFNFAGSQQLAAQLGQGARADLFASADERWMRYVAERDLLADAPRLFAHNRLIVIVPSSDPARIGSLHDLARRGVKLVVAAEAVPVGSYTREMLARLARAPGFGDDFDRLVLANVVSQEENVKGVVSKVQLGEADAGVVYASDAVGPVSRRLRVIPIPESRNVLASYPLARLRGARSPGTAAAFVDLILGDEGQAVLERHGLLPAAIRTGLGSPTGVP